MPQINGIETTAIAGLGQIGVTSTTRTIYPSGGLVVNSGILRPDVVIRSGQIPPTGSTYFYSRPQQMDSASLGTSNWVKIVSNDQATFFLSSSGELYAIGGANSSPYTGTGKTNTLSKVTTGSNWTDIAAGATAFAIGICDGRLFGIGLGGNGQFGDGTTNNRLNNFSVINNNTYWTRVSCGNSFSMAMSGSGGSGSIFSAGFNSSGRTGQNTTLSTNTTTWTQVFGHTNRVFTDLSCGEDFALAISGGYIYGTGEAGTNQLGNNSTTDRGTFGLVSSASTFTKVFAFTDFSKAIDINTHHYHAGNENYTRGDGDSFTAVATWTRLNTTGEFATGWQNFYSYHLGAVTYGVIGVDNNRPFYIGPNATNIGYMPNTTWTDYQNNITATWTAFVSGSPNVSCSAAAFGPGFTSIADPILFINLTPV
jgi:hypothetical protein